MTEERRTLGRRNFIKAVATLPAAGALAWKAASMSPVRAAVIGCGGQGRVLLENAPPSHLRIVAICDIAPDNRERALEIARTRHDPNAEPYEDYRQLLERRDVEAVLIASPLWLHERMTVDSLQAGKHTFCEKTMAHSVEECRRMVEAARGARRVLQIGHQRNYNPLYKEAKQLIQRGEIGEVYHVRALWHRNGDWRRPVPDLDFDPSPWGYPSLEHLKNWRLFQTYSQGLMAELGSHQIEVVNSLFGRLPSSVFAAGGVHRYQDGREVSDHIYAVFEYPGNLVVSYSSIQSNAHDHYYEAIFGTQGTIILGGETEALLFYEGDRGEATQIQTQAASSGPVLEASESRAIDAAGGDAAGDRTRFRAVTAYRFELEGFCNTVRHGAPNLCDGPAGMNACVPILMANKSVDEGKKLEIPAELYWSDMVV